MTPLSEYLKQIEKALQAGDATEHTYRPALKESIEFSVRKPCASPFIKIKVRSN